MDVLYLAKVPAFAMIMAAENISFRPPNNPFPQTEDQKKFGRADLITRLAGWFPPIGLVRPREPDIICWDLPMPAVGNRLRISPL